MDPLTGAQLQTNGLDAQRQSSNGSSDHVSEETVSIAAHGDLVLRIEHQTAVHTFRVSSPTLKAKSKYFEGLLQPGRFGESTQVEEKHKHLRAQYESLMKVPSTELPVINIKYLGQISKIGSVQNLFADFLYILHGTDTQTFPPVVNLANLAIVADRFDALSIVAQYVKRKKMIRAIDGKITPKLDNNLLEERVRQRLLAAVMLDYPPWVQKYSAKLVIHGWVGRELHTDGALWWDLPSRFEEELVYRRDCILETIQSLQTYFLGLYTGRQRQCKLGYDSSAQCDSYQLGEMIRFFSRVGTLRLQGALSDANETPPAYPGNIYNLLDALRGAPEYQIDRNHTHCGIRTKLVPLLDLIEECLVSAASICPECWQDDRVAYVWVDSKRPLVWHKTDINVHRLQGHAHRHLDVRSMFTATERVWSDLRASG